jgi:aminoglycoside phosphotransferase (APT) family kinase protein
MVEPWMLLPAAVTQRYVHGDFGTSNVIVDREGAATVLTLVDFEDSHVGDPAEDFKWQVLAGPQSLQYAAMRAGYATAGRALGPKADERLALAGAELCLDVLHWDAPGDRVATFQDRCVQTLDQLVCGQLPEPP